MTNKKKQHIAVVYIIMYFQKQIDKNTDAFIWFVQMNNKT